MINQRLSFGEHMKRLPHEDGLRRTYLGQAHIAGTGPEGKTCRECAFWGVCGEKGRIKSPGHYAKSNKESPGLIKRGGCHKLTHRKPNRRFPHDAMACRLFEQNEAPPPVKFE